MTLCTLPLITVLFHMQRRFFLSFCTIYTFNDVFLAYYSYHYTPAVQIFHAFACIFFLRTKHCKVECDRSSAGPRRVSKYPHLSLPGFCVQCHISRPVWCCALRLHKLRLLTCTQVVLFIIYSVEGGAKQAAKQDEWLSPISVWEWERGKDVTCSYLDFTHTIEVVNSLSHYYFRCS